MCSYPFQVFLGGYSPPPVLVQSPEGIKKTSVFFRVLLTDVLYTRKCRSPGLSLLSWRCGCESGPYLAVFSQKKKRVTATLNYFPPWFPPLQINHRSKSLAVFSQKKKESDRYFKLFPPWFPPLQINHRSKSYSSVLETSISSNYTSSSFITPTPSLLPSYLSLYPL